MYKETVIRICVEHKSNALASEIKQNIWNTFYIINTAHHTHFPWTSLMSMNKIIHYKTFLLKWHKIKSACGKTVTANIMKKVDI